MRNNLVSSALIVFLFWYAAGLLFSGAGLSAVPYAAIGTLAIWAVGWSVGVVFALAYGRIRVGAAKIHAPLVGRDDWFGANEDAEATVVANPQTMELTHVPLPAPKPVARGRGAEKLLAQCAWWPEYLQSHPQHARAMLAVVSVMQSKPGLPAAPEAQGHGGATLWQHSCNVLSAIIELAPAWRYTGIRNRKGGVVVPVRDLQRGYHAFDGAPAAHPLLYLAAIAHDLGKVECYERERKNGRIKEIKGNHGTVGATMLRRMPEIMALPIEERDALILAVSYYHHVSDMPTSQWIGDLVRSLTMLLYDADCLASVHEGDPNPEKAEAVRKIDGGAVAGSDADDDAAEDIAPHVPQDEGALDAIHNRRIEAEEDSGYSDLPRDLDPVSTVDVPQPIRHDGNPGSAEAAPEKPAGAGPHWVSDDGCEPITVLGDLLAVPDAVNGKNADKRIAIKFGEWLYVFEPSMRQAAAKLLQNPDLAVLKGSANMNPFTKELLRQLDERGLLMSQFEGQSYSYLRGLWKFKSQDGSEPRIPLIVIRSSILRTTVADAKYPPNIVGNFWGASAASNKKRNGQGAANEKAEPDEAEVASSDGPAEALPDVTYEGLRDCIASGKVKARNFNIQGENLSLVAVDDAKLFFAVDVTKKMHGVRVIDGQSSKKHYLGIQL